MAAEKESQYNLLENEDNNEHNHFGFLPKEFSQRNVKVFLLY